METVRTPDDRFENLPGYDFEPNYATIPDEDGGELRVHYIDFGLRSGEVVLLMHGEPSWSYLYRKMIPILAEAGYRVIVPDLVGFGRSDKPTEQSDYTYARHVAWMRSLLFDHLDLTGLNMFCQDWGGLVGLRLVAESPERFDRVCVGNTGMPTGTGATDAFRMWRDFASNTEDFDAGGIIQMGTVDEMPDGVVAAYNAPYPDDSYKAGARIFPALVPVEEDNPAVPDNIAAWERLAEFDKPFLVAFSDGDPITAGGDGVFHAKVPGTKGQPHTTIEGGGHFLQEDQGPQIARKLIEWMAPS
ncbi:MAG: haloalkane dehalogenase [Microthrixaceae bacterium]